jgi:hypothetical protein
MCDSSSGSRAAGVGCLPDRLMCRVYACAYMLMGTHVGPRVIQYAREHDVCVGLSSVRYVWGALRGYIRRGIASTYAEALDMYEDVQVGSRPNPLMRTISADRTAHAVARICRDEMLGSYATVPVCRTVADPIRVSSTRVCTMSAGTVSTYVPSTPADTLDYVSGAAAYTTIVDGHTVYGPMAGGIAHYSDRTTPRSHAGVYGKAVSTLYAAWHDAVVSYDPAVIYADSLRVRTRYLAGSQVAGHLRRWMHWYYTHLSGTHQQRVRELIASQCTAEYIMSAGSRHDSDPGVRSLAEAIKRLYRSFSCRGAVTGAEYVYLVRRYLPVDPGAS